MQYANGTTVRLPGAPRILLAASGSVASIKMPILVRKLKELHKYVRPALKGSDLGWRRTAGASDIEIKVISTTHALHFFNRTEVEAEGVPVYTDAEEWAAWTKMSDPVLHIDLRAWADLLLIAPLSANTLSKLASGASDNLLTCVLRAWDTSKPVILCPAMNMHMWTHPFTARHLEVCTSILGYRVIDPVVKKLACGDLGNGAMAEVDTIIGVLGPVIEEVKKVARQGQALATSITTAASLQDVLQSNLGPTGTQKMRGIGSQAPLG